MADPTASGVPSLDEFLTEVKPLNPDASNSELIDAYHQQFGTTPTAASPRATLPSYDEFKPEVKRLNPTATNSEIHQAWQDEFGVMGAREKKPTFSDAFGSGLKQGWMSDKESFQGTKERLLDPNDPLKKFTREAGDALAGEAAKLGVPKDLQSKPFWDRVSDPEWMGNFLGNTLAGSAPSMVGAVAGGVAGALTPIPGGAAMGAAAGMGGVTFFQEAGSSYREAYDKYIKAGFSEQKAHENAYEASGVAGAVSGVVNSLAVPASLMSPAKSVVKNLFMRYLANVAIDTGDQVTGNIVAKQYHDPDRPVMQGAPEAVLGSAILGAPETMGAVKIGVMPKQVAKQRAQPDQGLTPDSATPGLRNTPLKTELRVDGQGPPVGGPDPLTHAEPVLKTTTVDDAIEVASKVTDDVPIDLDALKREVGEEVTVEKIEAEKTADVLAKQAQREADRDLVDKLAMTLPADRVNGRLDAIDTSTLPDAPDAENPTQLTKPQYQALSDIYQLDGKRLVVVSPNAKFAGVVNPAVSDSTAFISARTASDPANVAFHEYQHLLQKSEIFETYRSTLREELQPDATDTAKKYHSRGKGISDDQLFNEISADVHGDAMTRPTFHAKLIQKLEAQEGPDVAQTKLTTLLDSLKEMLGRLQQYLTGRDYTKLDADGKAVAERYVKNLERVHDALASAMAEHYRKQGLLADGKTRIITPQVNAEPVSITPQTGYRTPVQPAGARTDEEFNRYLNRTKKFLTTQSLPGFMKQAVISQERMEQTNDNLDPHLTDAEWKTSTVSIASLREKNPELFSKTFTHRGSVTKGPIVLDHEGVVIDGNNRTYEAIRRGERTIEAFHPADTKTTATEPKKEVTKRDLKTPVPSGKLTTKPEKTESTPVDQAEKKEVAVTESVPAKKTDTKAVTKVDELQEAFGADTKEVKQLLDILDNPAPRGKIQAAEARLQEVMSKNEVSQKEFNRLAYGIGTKDIDVKPEDYTAFAPNLDPGYTVSQPTAIDTYIRKLQDKNIDLKRLIEAIETSGQKVPDELNPVFREEMFHKRAEQRSTDFTNNELKPLLKWMRANKISLEQLDQYMHARHVINDNLNARLQEMNPDLDGTPEFEKLAGITDVEAKTVLKKFDKTLMETAAKKIDAMVEKTRVMMVDYGLESQERIDGWRDQYRSYVPLHREGFEDGGHPTGTGMSVRGTTAKDRLGSALKVVDVVANIAQARDQVISRGEKMRPVVALAGLLLKFPNKNLAKLDKYAPVTVTDPTTGLETTLPGDLGDYKRPMINRRNKKTGQVESFPDPTYKSRDNVVNFRIGGKDYAIIFNERDERAKQIAIGLKNLDTPPLNGILRAVAPYTRYLAAVNTQYNPIFGAVNFVRDAQFAMLTLKSTELDGKQMEIVGNAKKALFGIWQDARAVRRGETATSPTAQLWERFQHVGGPTGYRDLFFTSTERAEELTRLLSPNGWKSIRSLPHFVKQMENTWLFEKLADYNLAMENAIRLGVFQAGVENGLSDIKAASLAKNITVNFNKKGQIGAQAGALYAFFNANVQGTARIAETLFERSGDGFRLSSAGKQIVVGGLLVGVLQTFALAMAGFEDDEPPEFIKNRNLVIPAPGTDKGYVSLPMPLGFNLLPTVGRLAAETIYAGLDGRSPKIMEKGATLMAAMVDTFNPLGSSSSLLQVGSPTVTDPIVALAENKDWTGKPISHPDYSPLRPTPGHTRAKDTATIWSIGLSKMINWATGGTDYVPGALSPTPDAIDYLIGQATGGVGREISKAAQVARSEISGEALPVYKLPAIGRFAGTAGGTSGIRDKFYDHIREVNAGALEVEGRMKNGESFSEFLKEHPESRLKSTALRFQKQLGELREQKTQLLDRSAPKSEVERKEQQITNLMKLFNDQVERVKR